MLQLDFWWLGQLATAHRFTGHARRTEDIAEKRVSYLSSPVEHRALNVRGRYTAIVVVRSCVQNYWFEFPRCCFYTSSSHMRESTRFTSSDYWETDLRWHRRLFRSKYRRFFSCRWCMGNILIDRFTSGAVSTVHSPKTKFRPIDILILHAKHWRSRCSDRLEKR